MNVSTTCTLLGAAASWQRSLLRHVMNVPFVIYKVHHYRRDRRRLGEAWHQQSTAGNITVMVVLFVCLVRLHHRICKVCLPFLSVFLSTENRWIFSQGHWILRPFTSIQHRGRQKKVKESWVYWIYSGRRKINFLSNNRIWKNSTLVRINGNLFLRMLDHISNMRID